MIARLQPFTISNGVRAAAAAALITIAARVSAAQDPLSHAKAVTKKAVAAENAHIEAEQHPEAGQKSTAKAAAKSPAAVPNATSASTAADAAKKPAPAPRDTVVPEVIMREAFEYDRAGRRDPFVSLLTTDELRPTITDLKLTGIIYDRSPAHNSVATLRDQTANKTYSVRSGTTLGRMRVTAIKPMSVVFTIDEFGTTRQDSLVLRDPTKARER